MILISKAGTVSKQHGKMIVYINGCKKLYCICAKVRNWRGKIYIS